MHKQFFLQIHWALDIYFRIIFSVQKSLSSTSTNTGPFCRSINSICRFVLTFSMLVFIGAVKMLKCLSMFLKFFGKNRKYLHFFKPISKCSAGRIKSRRGPHTARGPAVAHIWCRWCEGFDSNSLGSSKFYFSTQALQWARGKRSSRPGMANLYGSTCLFPQRNVNAAIDVPSNNFDLVIIGKIIKLYTNNSKLFIY